MGVLECTFPGQCKKGPHIKICILYSPIGKKTLNGIAGNPVCYLVLKHRNKLFNL